jgi:hypothetical protein
MSQQRLRQGTVWRRDRLVSLPTVVVSFPLLLFFGFCFYMRNERTPKEVNIKTYMNIYNNYTG